MRTIFHLDLDAFFISVERILDPTLEGKPVIVGGDPHGRGVVAACSYEARKYGLRSGMPIRDAYRLCTHGVYLHGHHQEYSNYSQAVKRLLEGYAPLIEQASIDEFYMDFTGCSKTYGPPLPFARRLQEEVLQKLSLPCSIGIASNKTLAKVASDFMKPRGITFVLPGMEKEFLRRMPVEALPGVGKVTLRELNSKGFYKVGDIANLSEEYLNVAFGKHGLDLWNKANGRGNDCLSVSFERKSISKEHTFGEDTSDNKKVEKVLFGLTGHVCQSLRDRNWQTSTISIKLRYSDFNTVVRSKTTLPTDDDQVIYQTAADLFRKACQRRVAVRLIGIHLSNFCEAAEQEGLFDAGGPSRRKRMLSAVDALRNKYGYAALLLGKN
ncbi:MAG: DNA polymerase IV [Ignavibacteria bacterium]|jgi:DNA polymerase-4|nr:DNA polymerase IV [Ignavibacteria bacterium]MCU7515900.1 DNA polymerase IV [Ignavibacteria bacterium]